MSIATKIRAWLHADTVEIEQHAEALETEIESKIKALVAPVEERVAALEGEVKKLLEPVQVAASPAASHNEQSVSA